MKRLMTTVFFGLWLTGCQLPPPTAPASPSTEPFQTKTNDTLGIRLGMPWAEFIKKLSSRRYLCMPDERARFCTVVADEGVMVGGGRVKLWSVRFYQERLIGIDYSLTVLDPFVLLNGFREKFGLPTQSSPRSCGRTCARTWRNAISSMRLTTKIGGDLSAAKIEFSLDKETNDWLEWSQEWAPEREKRRIVN
jgi:hypothetical protein